MCCKGFLNRVLPFFLTFAVGLLVASFFVSITPNFKFQKRGWSRHQQYHQRIESENMRLREENNLLKRQLLENQTAPVQFEIVEFESVADAPPLPVKPVRQR